MNEKNKPLPDFDPREVATFKDVVVTPYESLLYKTAGEEKAFHKGGPLWPSWESRGFERHWVERAPIDLYPSTPDAEPESVTGTMFWCGAACTHFGHQIMDFSTRVVASRRHDPAAKLLFAKLPSDTTLFFFFDILEWLGVDRTDIRLIERPIRVDELMVVPQCERREACGPTDLYLTYLDELIAQKSLSRERIARPVYVSRAQQKFRFAGEDVIEHAIAGAGGLVVRPENYPLREQVELYLRSDRLVFAEGSAIHPISLAGRGFGDVDVLLRRPGATTGQAFLEPRARSLRFIDALKGNLYGAKRKGVPGLTRGLPIIDPGKLADHFAGLGLDLRAHWDEKVYRAALTRDIRRWATLEFSRPHPVPDDHIAFARASIAATFKGDEALVSFSLRQVEEAAGAWVGKA